MPEAVSTQPTTLNSPLSPDFPQLDGQPLRWSRLYGSSLALALLATADQHAGPVLVVCPDTRRVQQLRDELAFYRQSDTDLPVLLFPDWECLPYDAFSPHQDIISERLLTLYRLPSLKKGIVLATVTTLMHRLPPLEYVTGHTFLLSVGEQLNLDNFRDRLVHASYQAVSQVMAPGEYAIRGGLIDIFPMGSRTPYRIDLFDTEIESIRKFDPASQRSGERLTSIRLLPAREYPMTEAATQGFRQAFRANFEGDPQKTGIYRDVSNGISPPGIEYYLPLFFESTLTLFDYLPADALTLFARETHDNANSFESEVTERYLERRADRIRPVLPPERLFIDCEHLFAALKQWPNVELLSFKADEEYQNNPNHSLLAETRIVPFDSDPPPLLPVNHKAEKPYHALFDYIDNTSTRVLLVADTAGRRETLRELLIDNEMRPEEFSCWHDFLDSDSRLGLILGQLDRGLILKNPAIAVITEAQLYGQRAAQRRRRSVEAREPETIIRSLAELKVGDPVVHEDHGVGRYLGLQTLDVGDHSTEFLTLEYAGDDKLYIPVVALHLISRYTGTDPEHAPLHKLGSDIWEKARRRAQKKAHDAAAELLEIYARRAARQGHKFDIEQSGYDAFADSFPFEETPDQMRAIEEVVGDMGAPKPMDRLVCGDVGFGKTEVALRAAYIAVNDGKQVALLVPTTLLAQQHYQNFKDRFADSAVKIDLLSRFRNKGEIAKSLKDISGGAIDIVVGTHRLLQSDIKFKNLGLLIVDEEHRFGVRQKERIKKLRSEVDILTLTATPIPRTLNMGLAGLRDISIIATAPEERLSVKTFVYENNDSIVREACLREIRRGGQVYFLHNDVRTMEKTLKDLEKLMPEAEIHMAHGQMRERELEQIMLDFYHQRFSILLCSTIIESGIDVPSANTIIIQRADKFGLAQLHQLRGRVGRSHHRAYAYLFIPSRKGITSGAEKRLEAIVALDELGAGFSLASHDLEIRGAGELLGESQSGDINEVGFSLYSDLLNRAIKSLQAGKEFDPDTPMHSGTEINIHAPALLPETYLPDVHMRLVMYKRIANAGSIDALKTLKEEMIDRFGILPEEAKLLFRVTELKLLASRLDIRKIDAGPRGARIEFYDEPDIDPAAIIRLIQSKQRIYKLDGPNRLRINTDMAETDIRLKYLIDTIAALTEGSDSH